MNKPTVLRKRYIPDEVVDISGDEILFLDDELLITKWKTIKPRKDFTNGISYAFLKKGIKISRFYKNEEFIFWYCDIINAVYDMEKNTFTLTDLILDLKVLPDGKTIVLDLDELSHALTSGIITVNEACRSLEILDSLLKSVYEGNFPPDICNDNRYLSYFLP